LSAKELYTGKIRNSANGVFELSSTNQSSPGIFGVPIETIFVILIVAAVAVMIERLIARYVSQVAKRLRWEPHTANNMVLTARIFILLGAIAAVARVAGLPPDWILSVSAIGGAALGFASQKTIGNFIAGLLLLSARPFKVGDYVRIGSVEGIVQELTINYTKVFTNANNTVAVSNLQVLDRDITNFAFEPERAGKAGIYCYTFEMGFDHNVSAEKMGEIFEEVFGEYKVSLPKIPSYTLLRSGGVERVYMIYIYVREPEDIFRIRAQIANQIYSRWDKDRAKK
jgi:small-conductance mechanosensitive channel